VIAMKKRNKNIRNYNIDNIFSNQKGMALLTTLIFVFILVTFAVALLTMTSNDTKLSTLQKESTRAFYLAETGIDKALWYLNTPVDLGGKDKYEWRPGYSELYPDSHIETITTNENYEVTIKNTGVEDPNATPPAKETDTIEITSRGTVKEGEYSAGKRTIVVIAKIGISPSSNVSYDHAILTDGNMTLNGDISISGSIHSNGDITNNGKLELVPIDGASASGTSNIYYSLSNVPEQEFPIIDWEHFENSARTSSDDPDTPAIEGHYYGDNTSVVFNADNLLEGIHFIDGDVTIQSNLIFDNATIFATGTIDVIGSGDVNLINNIEDNPLALIAMGDITIGGSVHGEGIIQSDSTITIDGNVNIEEGTLYAVDGVLNGGGGSINVVYGSGLAGTIVPGTGVEVYLKNSWREAY
jgi:Tfp pilus assembly protein PilX